LVISFGNIPDIVSILAKKVSGQFEIIALAGIGMRVKFKDLIKEGPKAMVLGGTIGVSQVLVAIVLIFLLIK
ncbi:MAG: putative sulfate exporter family transporter, partial [Enterococcus sp.]